MHSCKESNQHEVLLFNKSCASTLEGFCAPLRDKYKITSFTFCRLFNNGSTLYLCSNLEWVEKYISNNFYDDDKHFYYYKPQIDVNYNLWAGMESDRVFDAAYALNIWHGIGIYEKCKDYIDLWDFGTDRENYQLTNFYLNNMDTMRQIMADFKDKASNLINVQDKNVLLYSKNMASLSADANSKRFLVNPQTIKIFMQLTEK